MSENITVGNITFNTQSTVTGSKTIYLPTTDVPTLTIVRPKLCVKWVDPSKSYDLVRANPHDAGLDLTATSMNIIEESGRLTSIEYGTNVSCEIPEGYVGLLFPRSSVTKKEPGFSLKNSVGVIDSGYRGEIKVRFDIPSCDFVYSTESDLDTGYNGIAFYEVNDVNVGESTFTDIGRLLDIYEIGERVAQLVIVPVAILDVEIVDELSDSVRGTGGFGSSGK